MTSNISTLGGVEQRAEMEHSGARRDEASSKPELCEVIELGGDVTGRGWGCKG